MKTKIGTSFGLALLLALGVLATMLALGMFSAPKAQAMSGVLDPGGGPATTMTLTVDPSGAFHGIVPVPKNSSSNGPDALDVSGSGFVPGTVITTAISFTGANTDTVTSMARHFYDPMSESLGNITVSEYAVPGGPSITIAFMDVLGTKGAVTGWRMTIPIQRTSGGQMGITPQLVPY